jgi:hypothetical protein
MALTGRRVTYVATSLCVPALGVSEGQHCLQSIVRPRMHVVSGTELLSCLDLVQSAYIPSALSSYTASLSLMHHHHYCTTLHMNEYYGFCEHISAHFFIHGHAAGAF